jgi:recombination protein RecT
MKADGSGATQALAKREKPTSMTEYLASVAPRLAQYLPKGMDPDRFMRIAIRALIQNPELGTCTKASLVIAIGEAAELGLVPNGPMGLCALVPYSVKGTKQAKCLVMYKGLLELMYRTGKFQVITADEVCENDEFSYEKGSNAQLRHVPALGNRGEPIIYYAYYKTKDGGFDFQVMTREECLDWGKQYSRAFNKADSPWQTAEAEMDKKTVLRKLAKYSPVSVDIPGEDFEEQPADAIRFSSLMDDAREAKRDAVQQGGETKANEDPQEKDPAAQTLPKGDVPAAEGAGPGATAEAESAEGQPAAGGSLGSDAPAGVRQDRAVHTPLTPEQLKAARAIDARKAATGAGMKKGVADLFKSPDVKGIHPTGTATGKSQGRMREPGEDTPEIF